VLAQHNALHARESDEWNVTFRTVRPDGSQAWIHGLGRAKYDEDGHVTRIVGISLDITAHRRAEDALQVSEHKLRLSLAAGQLGTWQYDLKTGVFAGGPGDTVGRKMHGFDPDEVIETLEQALRHVHPDDIPKIQHNFKKSISDASSHNHEYRVVLPNGETRWIFSVWMRQPGTSTIFGVVQDITERKRAELDLRDRNREQERTLRLLLETAAQGILSVNGGGFIVMANAATEKMFGWSPGELIGKSVEQLLPAGLMQVQPLDSAAYFEALYTRAMDVGSDLTGRRRDGTTFPIEISLSHVTTADGGHAIAFITDISSRKEAEAALRRSHAELQQRTLQLRRLASQLTLAEQKAREQLARTLHDGLQQLLFSASMMLDRAKATPQAEQLGLLESARTDIDQAMKAARTLSMDLFPPMLHIGGLPAALHWLAKRTQEQYGVVVNVTVDPQANPATSDVRILLFEAVRELLFNAVKHAHVDRVHVNLAVGHDDTIHIHVSDEGVGFDPAVTHHKQEVGLGLFSIEERLALLGGRLEIQSAPGKGARFSLTLSRSDLLHLATDGRNHDAVWQERLVYDSAIGTSKPLRILIADDHVVARAGLRELLSERLELYVVGEAANGVEAISQAIALQPDVIVMDASMPQMNGIEATREIREALPHIQIVGLSTHDDENSERSMREAGAEAYFTKNEGADRLLNYLLSVQTQVKGAAS
jgi:PAS domain S-box-containing protein